MNMLIFLAVISPLAIAVLGYIAVCQASDRRAAEASAADAIRQVHDPQGAVCGSQG